MIRAKVEDYTPILQEMEKILHTFDFDKNDFGTLMLDTTANGIMDNMDRECDPDDIPWAPLSSGYLEWKSAIAPQAPIGVLYGIMKTWDQIAGERQIAEEWAAMTYGIDPIAKIEAIKFTEGGLVTGTSQPPRPFYGLTSFAMAWCGGFADHRFENAW